MYTVKVNGREYVVEVSAGGDDRTGGRVTAGGPQPRPLAARLCPRRWRAISCEVNATVGDRVAAGDVILILEAMKMETEVRASRDGTVAAVSVKAGDVVAVGDALVTLA